MLYICYRDSVSIDVFDWMICWEDVYLWNTRVKNLRCHNRHFTSFFLFSSQCIQIGFFFFFFKETRDVAITKLLFLGTIQRFTIAALQRKRQKLCSQLVPHRKPDWIFMLQYAIAQFYLTMLKVGNAAEQCEENRWIVTKGKWTPLHVGCTGRGRGMSECVDGHERLRGWERGS